MAKFKQGVTSDSDMPPLPMSEEDYRATAYQRYNCIDEKSGVVDQAWAKLQELAGGTKHDSGKPDLSLVPRVALEEIAKALMYGEKKYGRYNYRKGFDSHRLLAAALRHVVAWQDGEDFDKESGLTHLGHALATLCMLVDCIDLQAINDTRFKRG